MTKYDIPSDYQRMWDKAKDITEDDMKCFPNLDKLKAKEIAREKRQRLNMHLTRLSVLYDSLNKPYESKIAIVEFLDMKFKEAGYNINESLWHILRAELLKNNTETDDASW